MKQLWIVLALFAGCCWADDANEYHTFTSSDGRTVDAKIVSYDNQSGKVVLERENRKTFSVNSSNFSEKDQLFIKSWDTLQEFSNPTKFKIDIKRNELTTEKKDIEKEIDADNDDYGGGGRRGGGGDSGPSIVASDKITEYNYILELTNKTGLPVDNLTMEYRIFYEQEKTVKIPPKRERKPDEKEQVSDYESQEELLRLESQEKIKRIEAGETVKISTGKVKITKRSTNRPFPGITPLKGELRGAWVKIIAKTPVGATAIREIALPPGIVKKEKWASEKKVQEHMLDFTETTEETPKETETEK